MAARRYGQFFSSTARPLDQFRADDRRLAAGSGKYAKLNATAWFVYFIPDWDTADAGEGDVFTLLSIATATGEAKLYLEKAAGAVTAKWAVDGTVLATSSALTWVGRREMRFTLSASAGTLQVEGADTGDGTVTGTAWSLTNDGAFRIGGSVVGWEEANGWVTHPYAAETGRVTLPTGIPSAIATASKIDGLPDPSDLIPAANRLFWYDARAKVLDAGVTQLTDLFALNHLTQATDVEEPAWDPIGGPGSQPIVQCDGVNDFIAKTSGVGIGTQDYDLLFLVDPNVWVSGDPMIVLYNAGAGDNNVLRMLGGPNRWNHTTNLSGPSSSSTSTTGAADGVPHLVRITRTTAGGLVTAGISVDGEALITAPGASVSPVDVTQLHVGGSNLWGNFSDMGVVWAAGAIGTLSLAQRVGLTRYINEEFLLNTPEPTT